VLAASSLHLPSRNIDMPGGPHPPLEVVASWPAPNLVNPEGRGMVTTILAAVFTPITIFVVFARLWVRFRLQRNPGVDDWLMVTALVYTILSHKSFSLTYTSIAVRHCVSYTRSME
jgi:hypothetical protein